MAQTYYERLGVASDASTDAVEEAFRTRLKEVHPDVSDDPGAAERTRDLIEAKQVLTDDHERTVYDRIGHASYTAEEADESVSADAAESTHQRPDAATRTSTAGPAPESDTDRERRRRNRETRSAWNRRAGGADGGVTTRYGPTWSTGVTPGGSSHLSRRLFPLGPSVVLLFVAFWLYPVMLWGAVEPAFPVAFNLVIAACTLAFVGYFLSMPPVAVAVFGGWTLLLPAGLASAGLQNGAVWLVAVVGTLVPLLLAMVAWAVLRA
jgi:molecular chaperone DnaJ